MTDPSAAVRNWYAAAYWGPQNKDAGWADYILIDGGALLVGRDVLNLGCYFPEDELAFAARARSWTAVDFTPEVIEAAALLAPWPPTVHFRVADIRALDLPNTSIDVALDFSTGDHLLREDYERALAEVWRVLRPDGLFVCVFTNRLAMAEHFADWRDATEEWGRFGYQRGDSPEEMAALLAAAGFGVCRAANLHLPRAGYLVQKRGPAA